MSRRRSSPAPAAQLDDDDLLREILLRLPPQPSSLPRASLVCTRWRSVLSNPQFLGRFRERHRNPPLLGFLAGGAGTRSVFTPVLESPDRIPAERFPVPRSRNAYDRWDFRGCRHGLAVLVNDRGREAVVWDPLTGHHRRLSVPFRPGTLPHWHAAVMRITEAGEAHGGRFSSPFKLVLMCQGQTRASACLYSSASGAWGNVVSTAATADGVLSRPGVLVGNAVHWLFLGGGVLVFDTETQSLATIDKPADLHGFYQLLRTGDDGSLGLAVLSELTIQLWRRQSDCNGVVEWVRLQKIIQLEELFPQRIRNSHKVALVVGYDEDSNAIVLATDIGVFMLQIESMQLTTICNTSYTWDSKFFYPYRNFYTAGREVEWKWVNPEL